MAEATVTQGLDSPPGLAPSPAATNRDVRSHGEPPAQTLPEKSETWGFESSTGREGALGPPVREPHPPDIPASRPPPVAPVLLSPPPGPSAPRPPLVRLALSSGAVDTQTPTPARFAFEGGSWSLCAQRSSCFSVCLTLTCRR